MPTTWLAATTGQPPLAQQVNQLLTTHSFQNLYTGTLQANATGGSGTTSTNGLWLAQSFTTGASQTTIGYGLIQVLPSPPTSSSALLGPTTVSVYTNAAGAPGTALVTAAMTVEYANATPLDAIFPLPVTGLSTSTQYWIVVAAAGNSSNSYVWNRSSAASGASTSTNGTSWAAQSYGFRFKIYDQSVVQPLAATWEDGGQRWTAVYYNSNGAVNQYGEYTAGQTAAGYTQSIRSLTYTSGSLKQVS